MEAALGLVLLALGPLGSWRSRAEAAHPLDSGEYLIEQLPGEADTPHFRPRSAKEALRAAARQAQREQSDEHDTFAVMHHNAFGAPRGQRVVVYDAVEATTSRFNFRRFDRFRKVAERQPRVWSRNTAPGVRDAAPAAPARGGEGRRQGFGRMARRPGSLGRGRGKQFEKKKRARVKREIIDKTGGHGFELPPMPNQNEWNPKLKKKKKKKKKKEEEVTTKRTIQTRSKKHRPYLKSLEKLGPQAAKKKNPAVQFIRGISRELKELLKDDEDEEEEEYTLRPHVAPTKAKYVPVPKNWQNPPSWKPATRGTFKKSPARMWQYSYNIVTIGPQVVSEETSPPPAAAGADVTSPTGGEVDPSTGFDWKQYDNPLKTKEDLVLKPAPEDWPQPTHPADGIYDWHKSQFKRAPRTPMPFATQAPLAQSGPYGQRYSEESAMYRRSDMWQTRPWNARPQQNLRRMYLTTESSATMDVMNRASGYNYRQNSGRMGSDHQESRQYSYQHGPRHSAWQGSVRGHQQGAAGVTQYQTYQQQYANYSSYYNYYHNYYSQMANNSKGFHHQQSYNQQDRQQASGHYQSHYHYQHKDPSYQYQHSGMRAFTENTLRVPGNEIPYRMPTEYAGNDRDLRGPRNRMPWARQGRGYQRPWRRPTGYHSIFSAPLHPWSTTPAPF